MSLQRSKSAPHPISGLTSLPRTASFHYKQAKTGHATPLHTPRIEKEDPFSLSGFFPRIYGNEDEWRWLRDEQQWVGSEKVAGPTEEEEEEEEEKYRVIFGQAESENTTREMIKDEDKLGVLSLGVFPP
ncbi:hypothetical protein BDZ94DRAFT_1262011 [Collybia nuda]|uniref:Uncharacterized protein n=1 Tax=Collybia nuda TaxID=64659 RepID=A0A9P5Y5Q8_9AGAR|nr:hypothetical protein BDZ94DRAFT_1262011 [Collybia nuda]